MIKDKDVYNEQFRGYLYQIKDNLDNIAMISSDRTSILEYLYELEIIFEKVNKD